MASPKWKTTYTERILVHMPDEVPLLDPDEIRGKTPRDVCESLFDWVTVVFEEPGGQKIAESDIYFYLLISLIKQPQVEAAVSPLTVSIAWKKAMAALGYVHEEVDYR